jgi:hypothetical protein
MKLGETVLVACMVGPGAFSGECVIRMPMLDPDGEFYGIAPRDYCQAWANGSLPSVFPVGGPFAGYVMANVSDEKPGRVRIALPGLDLIWVASERVRYREITVKHFVPIVDGEEAHS